MWLPAMVESIVAAMGMVLFAKRLEQVGDREDALCALDVYKFCLLLAPVLVLLWLVQLATGM